MQRRGLLAVSGSNRVAASETVMEDRLPLASALAGQFVCPGQSRPIERAVHLSRLAAFDPACLACPDRHDTAGLTTQTIAARSEVERRASHQWRWTAEGLVTSERGQLDREMPRQFAFALADLLWCTERERPCVHIGSGDSVHAAELLAVTCRALELAGCEACEVGPVTAPCLAAGIGQDGASGGIWIGNASGYPHEVCLLAWGRAGVPWSRPGCLSEVRSRLEAGAVRPRRSGGSLRRFDAGAGYLARFRDAFHGLRALEYVLHTLNTSLSADLESLSDETALRARRLGEPRMLAAASDAGDWLTNELSKVAREVVLSGAHFGIWIDAAGERCSVIDELGRMVSHDGLTRMLNRAILAIGSEPGPEPDAHDDVTREQIGRQMLTEKVSGIRDDGRGGYWLPGHAAPDALAVLCAILSLLSRSDQSLSEVLDATALSL